MSKPKSKNQPKATVEAAPVEMLQIDPKLKILEQLDADFKRMCAEGMKKLDEIVKNERVICAPCSPTRH